MEVGEPRLMRADTFIDAITRPDPSRNGTAIERSPSSSSWSTRQKSRLRTPCATWTERAIQARRDSLFPWGTLLVNIVGSLILGFLAGLPADDTFMAIGGVGFCGALTTYSTFSYESLRLAQERAHLYAIANITANIAVGLGAAYAGLALAQPLTG